MVGTRWIILNYFQGLLYRPRENSLVADLDDRALDGVRVRDHQFNNVRIRGSGGDPRVFHRSLALSKHIKRPEPGFGDQVAKIRLGKRLVKIIYPVEINAVFTKQLSQIPASRSGRFFVNDYLHIRAILPPNERVKPLDRISNR